MGMAKKRMSDEIKHAILNCGKSRYRIAKETGIDAAALCRFIHGETGLTTDTLDKLADSIGIWLVFDKPNKTKGR